MGGLPGELWRRGTRGRPSGKKRIFWEEAPFSLKKKEKKEGPEGNHRSGRGWEIVRFR